MKQVIIKTISRKSGSVLAYVFAKRETIEEVLDYIKEAEENPKGENFLFEYEIREVAK